jgi:hypothetical protein
LHRVSYASFASEILDLAAKEAWECRLGNATFFIVEEKRTIKEAIAIAKHTVVQEVGKNAANWRDFLQLDVNSHHGTRY